MVTRKKRTTNYLNNASLMEQIRLSKTMLAEKQKKNPDVTPAQCMTQELVKMLMMLVDRYSKKANWRGYCVDEHTECMTQRGWLGIDDVTTDDQILSYDDSKLVWSRIRSIFKDDYDGHMFRMTVQGMDSLVTPGHKFMTTNGLRRVDYLREQDNLVMIGTALESPGGVYSDAFVELVGWVITEGNYYLSENRNYTRITIYQNEGEFSDRIRACVADLGYQIAEYKRTRVVGENVPEQVSFYLTKELCQLIESVAPNKVPTYKFLMNLSTNQRRLLIDTMVDGDGWKTNGYTNYTQTSEEQIDFFVALCTLSGKRTTVRIRPPIEHGKKDTYTVKVFAKGEYSKVENIDFHGGKSGRSGKSKVFNPNIPTEYYKGRVWCPETEYGCFMARRNGTVFLTGNTYIEDMRSEALVSLLNGALKFDPEVGQNPFGYYTQIVHHSFLTTLEKEKKARKIRDDLLEQNGFNPSNTRQLENDSVRMDRIEREFYEAQEDEED